MPPVIASHHLNSEWQPRLDWSSDVTVQWGDHGLVFGQQESYTTAFFEAFPHDGSAGFVRGEGATLEDAEADAHAKWTSNRNCHQQGGHRWTRARRLKPKDGKPQVSTYNNGGCFCLRCNAFQIAMAPVVTLGDWKRPLNFMELESIGMGLCRRDSHEGKKSSKHRRKMVLRARLAGIDLPDPAIFDRSRRWRNDEPYAQACRRAVGKYCLENTCPAAEQEPDSLMMKVFQRFSHSYIENLKKEAAVSEGAAP